MTVISPCYTPDWFPIDPTLHEIFYVYRAILEPLFTPILRGLTLYLSRHITPI
jgi:hypothetical protein